MTQATQNRIFNDVRYTPEQLHDNAKVFLQRFVDQIVQTCKIEEYEGEIKWSFIDISPLVTCVQIQFIPTLVEGEEVDVLPIYQMFVSKRYFNNNMVRLRDIETNEIFVMQADARIVMSWLTF